ncbi:MAG: hypothetical protein RR472_02230 [Anaerovoracaceae bacterium]
MEIRTMINSAFSGVIGRPDLPMWEAPLIGVAAGDDPYYDFLKEHIGPFHWTPAEAFAKKYAPVPAKNLRVISMVFPQGEETVAEQKKQNTFPADYWLVSRGEWEPLMKEFGQALEAGFAQEGIQAVSIDLLPEKLGQTSETLGLASKWSHRHSAYAAGLGTFGLSDGFISRRGKAVRITSLVVAADIAVSLREAEGPYDWCLYYRKGICGACIRRCPARAIGEKGHDKQRCKEYEDKAEREFWPEHIPHGEYIFGCGLCQVKVPCDRQKP